MGQEDGRYVALAAEPFERRFWRAAGEVSAEAWRDYVRDAMLSPHAWGPGVEPTAELDALADTTGPVDGAPHRLDGREDAMVLLAAALGGCDAWVWRPDGPLSDLLTRGSLDVRPAFAAAPAPEAAAGVWQALCATARAADPAALPWWITRAMGGSWDVGITPPAAVRELAAALRATGAIAAIAAWPPASGDEGYGEDLVGLQAFLDRAAADGRWVLGTVAGT